MTRRIVDFLIAAVILCAAMFAAAALWRHGILQEIAPPKVVPPVSISIHGSDEVLAGREAVFALVMTGEHGAPQIKLVPDEPSALTWIDDRTLKFQSPRAGTYVLTVSVGGDARMSATDHKVFEVLEAVENVEPEHPVVPPINLDDLKALLKLSSAQHETPPPTVGQLVAASVERVASANKSAEARVIQGIFRSIINRIQTGLLPPEADPMAEIEDQLDIALGENARSWNSFTTDVRGILDSLRAQGAALTAAGAIPALEEVAGVLGSISSH